jgi:hypothetical protein
MLSSDPAVCPGTFTSGITIRSALVQIFAGRQAYNYTPGRSWGRDNVEAQASIVKDWYHNGSLDSDPRFRIIRDNIRTGTTR